MRHRRSQRDPGSTALSEQEEETQGENMDNRGRLVMRGMVGKLVLYLVILGILPSLRHQSTTTTTTTTDLTKEEKKKKSPKVFRYFNDDNRMTPSETTTFVTMVENVVPHRLASQWSNSIQQEWFRGPNGPWKLSKTQNKWILPSHHPLYQSITLQLQTFLLKTTFLSKVFHISNTSTVAVTPTNILISHYTTDSYDPNFLGRTTTNMDERYYQSGDDTTTTTPTSTSIYFHIFLLQKVVGMSQHEDEAYEHNKDVEYHTWERNYGGILSPTCTNENETNHCSNITAITPQFNMGIFWTCTSNTIWTLSPISQLAEEQHIRFFVLSGNIRIEEVVEEELHLYNNQEEL